MEEANLSEDQKNKIREELKTIENEYDKQVQNSCEKLDKIKQENQNLEVPSNKDLEKFSKDSNIFILVWRNLCTWGKMFIDFCHRKL